MKVRLPLHMRHADSHQPRKRDLGRPLHSTPNDAQTGLVLLFPSPLSSPLSS